MGFVYICFCTANAKCRIGFPRSLCRGEQCSLLRLSTREGKPLPYNVVRISFVCTDITAITFECTHPCRGEHCSPVSCMCVLHLGVSHLVVYIWWFTFGGLHLVVYVWWFTFGGLHLVIYVRANSVRSYV